MINQNVKNENPEMQIQCEFGDAVRELQISKLLKQANIKGKSGKSFYEVFQFLLLLVFQNCTCIIFLIQRSKISLFPRTLTIAFLTMSVLTGLNSLHYYRQG